MKARSLHDGDARRHRKRRRTFLVPFGDPQLDEQVTTVDDQRLPGDTGAFHESEVMLGDFVGATDVAHG